MRITKITAAWMVTLLLMVGGSALALSGSAAASQVPTQTAVALDDDGDGDDGDDDAGDDDAGDDDGAGDDDDDGAAPRGGVDTGGGALGTGR